jgi:pimeloyl-ACP methyl ester carboxylesterase
MVWEPRSIVNEGARVCFYTSEVPDGEWWVLWPALSCDHTSLLQVAEGLNQRGFSVMVPDPRPTGKSDFPIPRDGQTWESLYSRGVQSKDLELMVNQMGLEKPTFFAVSGGFHVVVDYLARTGNGSALYACTTSQNFALTSYSPGFYRLYERLRSSVWMGHGIMQAAHRINGSEMCYGDMSDLDGRSDAAFWLRCVDNESARLRAMVGAGKAIIHSDVTDELKQLSIPVYEIQGNLDWLIPRKRNGVCTARNVYRACAKVAGTHTIATTRPKDVLSAIDYLRSK